RPGAALLCDHGARQGAAGEEARHVAELRQRHGPGDEAGRGVRGRAVRREVTSYLDEVRARLHLDPRTSHRVINELSTHFEEKVGDLRQQGVEEAEAARTALRSFGDARSIARLLDE